MKNIYSMFIGVMLILMSNSISGQETTPLDLSKGKSYTESVNEGASVKFLIINKIPFKSYRIVTIKKNRVPDVLELPHGVNPVAENNKNNFDDPCSIIQEVQEIWEAIQDEKEVPKAIEESEERIKQLRDINDDCSIKAIEYLNLQINQTSEELRTTYKIGASQAVEVTIFRDAENESEVVWKFIYEAPMAGQWVTTYGFSFVAPIFDEPEHYYSQSLDSNFIVTEENNKNRPQFIPSIFFTWIPNNPGWRGFNLSGTGGLGFNFEAPTVFLGTSLIYHYNISLNLGIVAHQQDFLRGKYSTGQSLGENLSADQLHEKLYTVNPFVSLSFRLGQNPFASNNVQANNNEQADSEEED